MAGAGKFRQFLLLLWKNSLLQRRKVLVTFVEIAVPTIFALILIFIRRIVVAETVSNSTTWSDFDVRYLPSCDWPPCQGKKLYYTPNSDLANRVMERVKHYMGPHNISEVIGFDSENAMVKKLMSGTNAVNGDAQTIGGVVLVLGKLDTTLPDAFQYKIRLQSSYKSEKQTKNPFAKPSKWETQFMYPIFQRVGPRSNTSAYGGEPGYMKHGFLPLQHAIDMAVILENTNGSASEPLNDIFLRLKRNPFPPYNNDNFVIVLQNQLPVILLLSYVFIALQAVKEVVHEKERKLKETLKMMGMNNWLHWLAWFVKYVLFLCITVSIMTLFFCISTGEYGSIVGYTSPSVLFIFLLIYGISVVMFSFAVSVFFNKANAGAAAGGVLFFCSYIPYFFLFQRYEQLTWAGKIALCLIPNVAMSFGSMLIGKFEGTGDGITWSNIHQGVNVDDDFTMLQIILMLLVDSVIAGLITWYVEAVFPGEYGMPRPWYFPFQKSYWLGRPQKKLDLATFVSQQEALINQPSTSVNRDFFEKDPVGLDAGINMIGLRKVFGKGGDQKVAVAGTTLTMYDGQVTALLGHNGAGKTTTMSMLTGFIPPSSGTATVNGYDICTDVDSVRSSLGLCPQHNVLFDSLTVTEHLIFFAQLRGCIGKTGEEEIEKLLKSTGLHPKRDALAKTLSGGMKRKLSVAIALIGKPKVVILDEPTSGMDPDARRQTWDLLQQHRANCTMVLSTHFMDEADLLGDRIAIMSEGVLQCCGTSLFLKKKYGAGYHMVIVKEPLCDADKITELIQSYIPSAELESNISAELSYILPHETAEKFEQMFNEIELCKDELKIASYGASITTLEEVFLRVGGFTDPSISDGIETFDEGFDEAASTVTETESQSTSSGINLTTARYTVFGIGLEKNTSLHLYVQQFWGMFVKRVLHTLRNKILTISQLVVPLFFTIMGLIALKTLPKDGDSPELMLNISKLGLSDMVYSSGLNHTSIQPGLAQAYAQQFDPSYATLTYLNNVNQFASEPFLEDFYMYQGNRSLATYLSRYMIGAEFQALNEWNQTLALAYFNNQPFHTPAMTLNAIDNALYRYISGSNNSITVFNHPLPRTINETVSDEVNDIYEGFIIAFNCMFGMSFLMSSFTMFLVRENSIKAKHLQVVSGVHYLTFWTSTFLWDMLNYLVPCLVLMLIYLAFGIEAYYLDNRMAIVFLLFVLYGWANLPMMYIMSFMFQVPATGLVWLTFFNVVTGIISVIAVDILKLPQLNTEDVGKTLEWIFLAMFPNFSLGQSFQDIYSNSIFVSLCDTKEVRDVCKVPWVTFPCCKGKCGDQCVDWQENFLSLETPGIGRALIFLAIQGTVFFTIIFVKETRIHRKLWYYLFSNAMYVPPSQQNPSGIHIQEDSDVAAERERIASEPLPELKRNCALLMGELTKVYGDFLAVDRISVGVAQGECFGLLGLNGAGKTSTFKMLTGDITVTLGNAYVGGLDIKEDIKLVQRKLGYCPQFDSLIDQMTGRETLTMYARLRGIRERQIKGIVKEVARLLLLSKFLDVIVGSYSGGNKRKLSTAIALIGNPPVLFLDEPTTGMDPVARRHLWNTLSRFRASGRTLILTSHSMEECEALCTKIAIMVNGQFKCLGSPQHLKNKFGEGYTLIARVAYPENGGPPPVHELMDYIQNTFPHSELKDVHQSMIHYQIKDPKVDWGTLFGTMERAKEQYHIEDYSVSQTTLEQVFLNFARAQYGPKPPQQNVCERCWQCCTCCCRRKPPAVQYETLEPARSRSSSINSLV